MRVVHFGLGAPGCLQYRNVNPSEYLNRSGHEGHVVETDMATKDDLKKVSTIVKNLADIVVITRFNNWSGVLNLARKYKKHVVYELDDTPDLHSAHNAKDIAKMNRWIERTAEMASAADHVTVTTEPLADYIRPFNDRVTVTPNMVDYSMEQWKHKKKEDDGRVVIGYFGGSSHLPDMKMVAPVLMRIAKEFPCVDIHYGAVPTKVVVADPNGGATEVIESKKNTHAKAFHHLFAHLKKKRKKALYPLEIDEYGQVYKDFDIAIAPLLRNDFNQYKSNLKFLESSAYALPIVASNEYPYIQSVTESGGGFLAANQEEFYQALKKLVKSASLRKEMGLKAQEYAFANFDLFNNGQIYLDVYEEVLSNKPRSKTAAPIYSFMSKPVT